MCYFPLAFADNVISGWPFKVNVNEITLTFKYSIGNLSILNDMQD